MSRLDELMSLDPLELSSKNIDEIIALQREDRARFLAGDKPKKEKGPQQKIDLGELLGAIEPAVPAAQIKRRKL